MKKIVSAVAAAALLTSAVFAEVSWSANARVYTDALTSTSLSDAQKEKNKADAAGGKYEKDDTMTWFKDTKHSDDITLNAKGENAGAKIVINLGVGANKAYTAIEDVISMTSYQLWLNFGNLRLDAGTFDTRPINESPLDGNWGSNYGGNQKPGIYGSVSKLFGSDGKASIEVKDTGNVSILEGAKKKADVLMATYDFKNLANIPLKVRGSVFLTGASTTFDNDKKPHTPFVPFGIQAEYNLDKTAKIAFTAMMRDSGTVAFAGTEKNGTYDWSAWTFNLGSTITAIDKTTIMAGYSLGASVYGGDKWLDSNGKTVDPADYTKTIHAFDLRITNKSVEKLTLAFAGNVTFVPMSKMESDATGTDEAKAKAGTFDKFGYWFTLGGQYKVSDTVAAELQTLVANKNTNDLVTNKNDKDEFNAAKNMSINIRPGIHLTAAKNCILSAGVDIGLTGFYNKVVGDKEYSNLVTTVSIPLCMRVKL